MQKLRSGSRITRYFSGHRRIQSLESSQENGQAHGLDNLPNKQVWRLNSKVELFSSASSGNLDDMKALPPLPDKSYIITSVQVDTSSLHDDNNVEAEKPLPPLPSNQCVFAPTVQPFESHSLTKAGSLIDVPYNAQATLMRPSVGTETVCSC